MTLAALENLYSGREPHCKASVFAGTPEDPNPLEASALTARFAPSLGSLRSVRAENLEPGFCLIFGA